MGKLKRKKLTPDQQAKRAAKRERRALAPPPAPAAELEPLPRTLERLGARGVEPTFRDLQREAARHGFELDGSRNLGVVVCGTCSKEHPSPVVDPDAWDAGEDGFWFRQCDACQSVLGSALMTSRPGALESGADV